MYGGRASYSGSINLATLAHPTVARVRKTGDDFGTAAATAWEFNGDGYADIILGAPRADVNGQDAGEAYIVFGGNFTNSVTHLGTAANNTINGSAGSDSIVAGAGTDEIYGGGGVDVILACEGGELITVQDVSFARIDGGPDAAYLVFSGGNLNISLPALFGKRLSPVDYIDIRGTGANTLSVDQQSVLVLSSAINIIYLTEACLSGSCFADSNTLYVRRGRDDTVNIGQGWADLGTQSFATLGNVTFRNYLQGEALLLVEDSDAASPSLVSVSSE